MFKPIKEYVEGDLCTNCWGVGKTFGDVPTPKRIYITGSGFIGVCAPCNDTFIALQNSVNPCLWEFDTGAVSGSWLLEPLATVFKMDTPDLGVCYDVREGPCELISISGAKSVTISINEPPTPEYKIAIDQNFSPSLQTYFLDLGAVNSDEVLILARRLDQVNLHVRYEPEY